MNLRILCAASEEYSNDPNIGFEKDVEILENYFPGQVFIEREITTKRLATLVSKNRFDIIHLVLRIDEETGDLILVPGDVSDKTEYMKADIMNPAAFAKLVEKAESSLVVLSTCNAHEVAINVAPLANVITTNSELACQQAVKWNDFFYCMLSQKKPLFDVFDLAETVLSDIRMRIIKKENIIFGEKENSEKQ